MVDDVLIEHYKCPENMGDYELSGETGAGPGFFRFGGDVICYGHCSSHMPAKHFSNLMPDVAEGLQANGPVPKLPFIPAKIIENLRLERYIDLANPSSSRIKRAARRIAYTAYYGVRPVLPVGVRRVFQRAYLGKRRETLFPRWPLDRSVEEILERLLVISMKSQGIQEVPFIWFWPEGAPSCVLMTHDVETSSGRDFCSDLMDINDSMGLKASFQIVPEERYIVSEKFLRNVRHRGYEICIHDLNHDGHLYSDRNEFLRRAKLINQYGREFGAYGFRSAVLYRKLEWYDALDFAYDMSVPNAGHLDPQWGGCCTVFPYFVGSMVELPLTTTQDYSLFHVLGMYSLDLWKTQISLTLEKHGLISFIVHPDYVIQKKARDVYFSLLRYLTELRDKQGVWIAQPREVNRWWRERSQMKLIRHGGQWQIEGEGKQRARIAYARLDGDKLAYRVEGHRNGSEDGHDSNCTIAVRKRRSSGKL